ncbi:MAG TPA: family 1 encapsulin nanocompartment shell protein, partial [Acidimicrobiales bacterium]|nr:family 1 encapsulin nanocompartment shell protein [Acidimicrobiales bacterium]
MDHLYRDLAPISEAAWSQIQDEAKSRLVTHLAARKLVDVGDPKGWGYSATDLGRVEEVDSPSEGVRALRRRVLPVVELRADFAVSREELDDADRGAGDIELRELDEAVRQIALAENTA